MKAPSIYRLTSTAVLFSVALSLFTPSSRAAEPPSETAVWAKNKADDLFYRGKYSEAYTAYEAAEKYPTKNDEFTALLLLQKGLCRLKEKRTGDAFSLWSRLRGLYPKTAVAPRSLLLEADDPTNKSRQDCCYDEILVKYCKSEEAATVLQKRGQAAFDKKEYAKATECWGQFVSDFPDHKNTPEIRTRLNAAKLAIGGNKGGNGNAEPIVTDRQADDLLNNGNSLMQRGSYREAMVVYESYLKKFSMQRGVEHATIQLALCHHILGADKKALDCLLKGGGIQNSELAPSLLCNFIVQSEGVNGAQVLSQQVVDFMFRTFPKRVETERACLKLAHILSFRLRDLAKGEKYYRLALERFPTSQGGHSHRLRQWSKLEANQRWAER
jgi:tetratricopeptide (TPR) repeat protein